MLWFWFVIGFIMTIFGSLLLSYDDYINIKGFDFDTSVLGGCILGIGSILAIFMLLALGISWLATMG